MIASTVSSKMLPAIAKFEGFRFEETLPGFKWMGHRAQELKVKHAEERAWPGFKFLMLTEGSWMGLCVQVRWRRS